MIETTSSTPPEHPVIYTSEAEREEALNELAKTLMHDPATVLALQKDFDSN